MRRAPIRVRLTAWYVAVLAVVLLGLGAFVVTNLRSQLESEVDRSLTSASEQAARGYTVEGPAELRDVARSVLPGPLKGGTGVQVLNSSGGVVLAEGEGVIRRPLLDRAAVARVRSGSSERGSVRTGTPARHLRITATPVRRRRRRQVLVVAESLKDVDSSVHTVLVLLLVGGGASLAVLASGGWWIARQALRPVARMTTRADEIGIDDLSQRIAEPRVQDEVGHLAGTLNAMLARLEAGVGARDQLVADASHELRAPLAAMRSELEVSLRQDELAPQAREVLSSVRDEVLRMSRVVGNLLTLARLDDGRLELLLEPTDLTAIAATAARAHRAAADTAGVEVEVQGEPVDLMVDGERIEQVVSNLIDNAVRFAPAGSRVLVRTWRDGAEAGVTVTDQGPGVSADARERIFERFSREDPARGRAAGAGLGLAIAREIVRSHDGRIRVTEGERGERSTFVVSLPAESSGAPARTLA